MGEDWCARFFEVSHAQGFARDWILIAPIAPPGIRFGRGDEVPRLCEAVRARYQVEGERFHLAGQSNGGNSVFAIAISIPEQCTSLTVHTGVPPSNRPDRLKRLHDIPIFMYCGDRDCFGFDSGMEQTAKSLREAGHPAERLDFVNFPGIGHFGILDVLTEQPRLQHFWQRLEELRTPPRRLAASAKPTTSVDASSERAPSTLEPLKLEQLQNLDLCKQLGVDPAARELRLSEQDFEKHFGMTKEALAAVPQWKRDRQKRELRLF